jgi:uncharacterized membrane protein
MTLAAHNILEAFDALKPNEQQQVAVEILRRASTTGEIADEAYDEIAAEVFRSYDAEESGSA